MTDIIWIVVPVLFLIALVYSSVGLGGGSSYIAFLYLFGIPLSRIPPIALFFNIIVASIAFSRFYKSGYFKPKFAFPFLIASIPATFFSAQLRIDEKLLAFVFSLILFLAALILLFRGKDIKTRFSLDSKSILVISFFLGGGLGFLAGIIGIGGGIFLGPVLLLMGFSSPKHIAGICSAFVLINSVVGLSSYLIQGRVEFSVLFLLGLAVFVGGQIGAYFGTKRLSSLLLQKIFAIILLIVSVKLGVNGAFYLFN
ncbi:MAG: sulfite exporter TauE/SafE family protein [Candidatus Aminicenantes bacterium]|nr:sulfite exporter TauE/SafE family protein [Candidatus Aminicenantes bacterium]